MAHSVRIPVETHVTILSVHDQDFNSGSDWALTIDTYTEFGHKFCRKLVWKKPGSRQPTVRAGASLIKENDIMQQVKNSKLSFSQNKRVNIIQFTE